MRITYNPYQGYSYQSGGGGQSFGEKLLPYFGIGAQLFDTFSRYRTAKRNTQRTIAANKEEAEKAFQREIQMWHMMNEYNTPSAQMQRFAEAGLNPNLIYGQGTPGNVGSYPTYNPPRIDYQNVPVEAGPALREFQNIRRENPEIERAEEEAGIAKLKRSIKSMQIPGANVQYMIDNAISREFINLDEEERRKIIRKKLIAKLNREQQEVLANKLSNAYQREINRLARDSMSLGDAYYIRLAQTILSELGINTENLIKDVQGGQ